MILHGTAKKIEAVELESSHVIREVRHEYLKKINKQGCTIRNFSTSASLPSVQSWFDKDGVHVSVAYLSEQIIMDGLRRLEELFSKDDK